MKLRFIILSILSPLAIHAQVQNDSIPNNEKQAVSEYTPDQPVFALTKEQRENRGRFLRYSAHSGYRNGIPSIKNPDGTNYGSYIDTVAQTKRIVMVNLSIQDMLTHGVIDPLEIILEVKDPSKYRYLPEYGPEPEWKRVNSWCYEYMQPVERMKDLKLVDEDLAALFNVKAGREKRMTNVLVLKRSSEKNKLKSSGKVAEVNLSTGKISNTKFSKLVDLLSDQLGMLIVDETGYTGAVDMKLGNVDWKDIDALKNALLRYNLSLEKEGREMNMFVIKEIPKEN